MSVQRFFSDDRNKLSIVRGIVLCRENVLYRGMFYTERCPKQRNVLYGEMSYTEKVSYTEKMTYTEEMSFTLACARRSDIVGFLREDIA